MRGVAVAITLFLLVGCSEEGGGDAEYGSKDVGRWVKELSSSDAGERMEAAKAFVSLGPKGQGATDAIAESLRRESDERIAAKLAIALVQANTALSPEHQDLAIQTFEGWIEKYPYSSEAVQIAELERSPALGERAGKLFERLRSLADQGNSNAKLTSKQKEYLGRLQHTLNP